MDNTAIMREALKGIGHPKTNPKKTKKKSKTLLLSKALGRKK